MINKKLNQKCKKIKLVGLSASPLDGVARFKKNVDYVCKNKGGNGAFREFIDLIIISR